MTAKSKNCREQVLYALHRAVGIFQDEHCVKLSLDSLSLITGFNPSVICSWLNGKVMPSLVNFFWFIYALNCDFVVTDFDRKTQF